LLCQSAYAAAAVRGTLVGAARGNTKTRLGRRKSLIGIDRF